MEAMRVKRTILIALILVFYPIILGAKDVKTGELPCWVYQPVVGARIGVVGLARDASASGAGGKLAAIMSALKSLGEYYKVKLDLAALTGEIKEGKDLFQIGGQQFKLAGEISKKGTIYVYLIQGDKSPSVTELEATCSRECEPKNCNPSWLCNPMTQDKAGFLGISGRATSKAAQYKMAMSNALSQTSYIYGVHVDVEEEFSTRVNSLGVYNFRFRDQRVTKNGSEKLNSLRFLVTDSCVRGSELFLRVTTEDLKPKPSLPPSRWMENPNLGGLLGAVGSSERVSSGSLSDQIKLAIEKAVGNLALSKKLEITSSFKLNQNSNGSFFYRDLRTRANLNLKADLMGLYFQDLGRGRSRVNAWVVEHNP